MRRDLLIAVGAVFIVASCLDANLDRCASGLVCPQGTVCVSAQGKCFDETNVRSCEGKLEGARCVTSTVADGTCTGGVCVLPYCGDGVVIAPESCDGDNVGGATCLSVGFYNPDGLGCLGDCTFDTSACTGMCGDGVVNGFELCDGTFFEAGCIGLGYDYGLAACSDACTPDLAPCGYLGWLPESLSWTQTSMKAMTTADGEWFAVDQALDPNFYQLKDGRWERVLETYVNKFVHSLWAASGTDVFGVGRNVIVRWDGVTVTSSVRTEYLNDVHGSSGSDVYAVGGIEQPPTGDEGVILHFNGTDWQTVDTGLGTVDVLNDVHVVSADDVWVVGNAPEGGNGTVLHYNGSWNDVSADLGVGRDLGSVWASGSDVFVLGPWTIHHYDGSVWSSFDPEDVYRFFDLAGVSSSDVYAVGNTRDSKGALWHYDGVTWVPHDTSEVATIALQAVAASGQGEVRVAGNTIYEDTAVLAYSGAAWRTGLSLNLPPSAQIHDMVAGAREDFLAVGRVGPDTAVVEFKDGRFSYELVAISGQNARFKGLWANGVDDPWAVGSNQTTGSIFRRIDGVWTEVDPGLGGGPYESIWAQGGEVFVGSKNGIFHLDGTWSKANSDWVRAMWGASAADVCAVTATGTVLHFDGDTWSDVYTVQAVNYLEKPQALIDVWGSGSGDVYAVTDQGIVIHFDGVSWTENQEPLASSVIGLCGNGPNDVFVFGEFGELFRNQGQGWSRIVGLNSSLTSRTLGSCGKDHIVIAGQGRMDVLYRDFGGLAP